MFKNDIPNIYIHFNQTKVSYIMSAIFGKAKIICQVNKLDKTCKINVKGKWYPFKNLDVASSYYCVERKYEIQHIILNMIKRLKNI